jgi:hypothetical protein
MQFEAQVGIIFLKEMPIRFGLWIIGPELKFLNWYCFLALQWQHILILLDDLIF